MKNWPTLQKVRIMMDGHVMTPIIQELILNIVVFLNYREKMMEMKMDFLKKCFNLTKGLKDFPSGIFDIICCFTWDVSRLSHQNYQVSIFFF